MARAGSRSTAQSAGLLLYRMRNGVSEVLLVHPGGPFWKRRDEGAWSIPKGEIEPGENPVDVARRRVVDARLDASVHRQLEQSDVAVLTEVAVVAPQRHVEGEHGVTLALKAALVRGRQALPHPWRGFGARDRAHEGVRAARRVGIRGGAGATGAERGQDEGARNETGEAHSSGERARPSRLTS